MNHETKQSWIEAVMASDLGLATKVYAFGIFKHMYGTKDNAFPSGKAIAKATGLADGKFYLHNKALADVGYLEVTHRVGRSNLYQLSEPTHAVGNHLPTNEVGVPTEEVTPTHTVGTNTTSKTTKKTSKKKTTTKSASAPVDTSLSEDIPNSILSQSPSFEEIVSPLLEDSRFSLLNTDSTEPPKKKHRKQIDKELNQAIHEQVLRDMYGDNDEKTECGW